MPRLFVGLTLPDHIKQYLQFVQGGINHARWQSLEQMHLTLRFIGDVDGAAARDVEMALEGLSFAPFDVYCEGAGLFGKPHQARSVWAAVKPRQELTALHKKIDHALVAAAGLPREHRQYEPHITLARLKARQGPLTHFLENAGGLKTLPWRVDHVTLFLSELGRQGAHYTPLATYGGSVPDYAEPAEYYRDAAAYLEAH